MTTEKPPCLDDATLALAARIPRAMPLLATPTQGTDISSSRDHDPAIGSALEWRPLPLDDNSRDCADSALPEAMIWAGVAALDQVHEDQANYTPGVTADWDDGMIAVAVYRAMTAAALSSAEQVAGKVPGMQNNTSDTPTQEGVGREEIARALAHEASVEADGSAASWELSPPERKALYLRMADRALSLLPAPKPGEGAEQELAELKAIIADPALVHINMLRGSIATPPLRSLLHLYGQDALARWDASEGAPEGWWETLEASWAQILTDHLFKHGLKIFVDDIINDLMSTLIPAPERWREIYDLVAVEGAAMAKAYTLGSPESRAIVSTIEHIRIKIAALTSSSAKPGGEEDDPMDETCERVWRIADRVCSPIIAENEALAQSNRRLREAAEPIAALADTPVVRWDAQKQEHVPVERADDEMCPAFGLTWGHLRRLQAALKDNGHA